MDDMCEWDIYNLWFHKSAMRKSETEQCVFLIYDLFSSYFMCGNVWEHGWGTRECESV